jgi:hypothetical protein
MVAVTARTFNAMTPPNMQFAATTLASSHQGVAFCTATGTRGSDDGESWSAIAAGGLMSWRKTACRHYAGTLPKNDYNFRVLKIHVQRATRARDHFVGRRGASVENICHEDL